MSQLNSRVTRDSQTTRCGATVTRTRFGSAPTVSHHSSSYEEEFDSYPEFAYIDYADFSEAMADLGVKPNQFFPYLKEHGVNAALAKFGLGANA